MDGKEAKPLKNSIRKKINNLLAVSIVSLAVFMIVINLFITDKYVGMNSATIMTNSCELQAQKVDDELKSVEQAVANIYNISESIRPEADVLRTDFKAQALVHKVENSAVKIAESTEGVVSVFYRIAPELTSDPLIGFYYVKSPETGIFVSESVTDLLAYSPGDIETVGWYYMPVNERRAIWTDVYVDSRIKEPIISYAMPIYEGDTLIGVIGMDVDFAHIIRVAEDVTSYESSGAFLASMKSGQIHYKNCDAFGDTVSDEMFAQLNDGEYPDELIETKTKNGKYMYDFRTLRNGMKLGVYAKKSDITGQRKISVFASVMLFVIFLEVVLTISMRYTKRITDPIVDIAGVAKSYAEGNWDAEVNCDTQDEVQILADNISVMADNTKKYIEYINNMALKDELTGLRNKTAYAQYVDMVNVDYIKKQKEFAVLVCDINNLKQVNDTLGHDEGDKLINAASRYICKMFSHSPVFRIGGDEFAVILDSDDYVYRNELVSNFIIFMQQNQGIVDPKRPCVAIGMSVFKQDGETFDDLFSVADLRMYANKMELKKSRAISKHTESA